MSRPLAPHVAAAIARSAPGPSSRPAAAQRKPSGGLDAYAAHVQAGIQFKFKGLEGRQAGRSEAATEFVTYADKKLGSSPPPPPKRPVYSLSCDDKGQGCSLRSVETGRERPAGDLYAGFVRMSQAGGIYVSPRPGTGLQGDSHPSIASRTMEWTRGQRVLVAAGEVGILGGEIVGHNDKTGHYQTRHNRQQSGFPADRYHPYTQDPKEWYKRS
jgi:hypothetical protein